MQHVVSKALLNYFPLWKDKRFPKRVTDTLRLKAGGERQNATEFGQLVEAASYGVSLAPGQ